MAASEIFSKLAAHAIKGLMVHDQLANYYDFLGLDGFRMKHNKHYASESCNYRDIQHYYTENYSGLITLPAIEDPKLIPQSWYKYTKFDVDIQTKRNGVENGLKEWKNWETETLKLYSGIYKDLLNDGQIAAAGFVQGLIDNVNCEIACINDLILKLKFTDYDPVYITELNEEMAT